MKMPLDELSLIDYPVVHLKFAVSVVPALLVLPLI